MSVQYPNARMVHALNYIRFYNKNEQKSPLFELFNFSYAQTHETYLSYKRDQLSLAVALAY